MLPKRGINFIKIFPKKMTFSTILFKKLNFKVKFKWEVINNLENIKKEKEKLLKKQWTW